ncbi:9233_t:CDS:2 [Entrophospora sp. SA101]|nr:9233_t:CDS:2 [Entrophospora sp. SA101]
MEKEVQDTTILENLELITSLEESFHEEATAVIPTTKNYNQNDNRFKLDLQTIPIECARYGWINVGEDWLECEYCGEKMLVKIPLYPDLENHLEKQYYEALTTAHSTFCPWREIPCEESIYKFPILSSEETIKEFQKRIINLIKLGEKIPKIKANINKNDDEEFTKSMDLIIPAEAKGIDSMVLKSAIYLSLFGWKYISKYGIDELLCDVCFRECSVNDYKKKNSKEHHYNNDDDDVAEEILACKNEEEIWDLLQIKNNQVFNCEGEHYWYCLWIANEEKVTSNETSNAVN